MNITFWGTRGSLAAPGPETARYGGNTACVEVRAADGTVLVLDAGTGIRGCGAGLPESLRRVDILLTHLHMDHIQGLAFFRPLRTPGVEAHIWGPVSSTLGLHARLSRYLSPPLFPVRLRDLEASIQLHEVPCGSAQIGPFRLSAGLICHPDAAVGYRVVSPEGSLAYLPDHEPALGVREFPQSASWTSGAGLADGVDVLIHDAQYTDAEYAERVGWGHSSLSQARAFAELTAAKHLVGFHHDPWRGDDDLERMYAHVSTAKLLVTAAREGEAIGLDK
jgi:phosphoribosyl 1,2-cyclic phosphodiesterase